MTDIQPKEFERSEEYTRLLDELKNSIVSAASMVLKLYEQGKKDGLSIKEIRNDIEAAVDGVVKERRLRKILPLELKRHYTVNSALSAESVVDTDKELQTIIAEVRKEQSKETFDSNYDRIAKEVFGVLAALRARDIAPRIPELCETLHRERPGLNERGIKRQIEYDFMDIYPDIANDPALRSWTIMMK